MRKRSSMFSSRSYASRREPRYVTIIPGSTVNITEEPFADDPHEIFLSLVRCNESKASTTRYFFLYGTSEKRVAVVTPYGDRFLLRGLGGKWGSLGRKHYSTVRAKKLWTFPAEKLPDIRKHIPDIVDRTDTEGKHDWCVTKFITAKRVGPREYEFDCKFGGASRTLREAGAWGVGTTYVLENADNHRAKELCSAIERIDGVKVYREDHTKDRRQ